MAKTEFDLGVDQENLIQGTAMAELARIQNIRERLGDDAWARALGASAITQVTFLLVSEGKKDVIMAKTAEQILKVLAPEFEELHSHDTLGEGAAIGLVEELANRSFIPLEIGSLVRARIERSNRDSH